jgi:hypothetical protein
LSDFDRDYILNILTTGIIDIAEPSALFYPGTYLSVNIMFASNVPSTSRNTSRPETRNQLVALAKAGDVTALNKLINHTLYPLGLEVTTVMGNECLIITAILPETVDRLFLIDFVREALERLQSVAIDRVMIVGRDRARITPDWQHVLNLHQADLPKMPTPARQQQAQRKPYPMPQKTVISFRQRHPLMSKPLHLVLFLAACVLLVGGVFAAKTVFTVQDGAIRPVDFAR